MILLNAKKNHPYIITEIKSCDESVKSRLFQLGFLSGADIVLRRKAPFFGDPLLFEIGDSQIALTKSEAKLIEVKELEA